MQADSQLAGQVFGALFDHGGDAAFVIHRRTLRVLSANRRLEDMVGRSRTALLEGDAADLFARDGLVQDWPSRIVSRPGLHEEVALRRLDDYPVFVDLTVAHLEHADRGPVAACIARDTTERRNLDRELIAKHTALYAAHAELERTVARLEQARRSLQQRNHEIAVLGEKLTQASRRAAIGEFSAGIAHSMNNPMGALSSAIRQIDRRVAERADPALRDDLARFLRRSKTALSRLEGIVNAVRRVHRAGALASAPVRLDVASELDVALLLFEDRLSDIMLERVYGEDTRAVAPPDALHQVFSNLVDNAIRAMPGGGTLTVAIARRDDRLIVTVADTGEGVPDDITGTLFEPFVSRRDDGTGLGLCAAQRLARAWGGDVTLVPHDGGARFDIDLPAGE